MIAKDIFYSSVCSVQVDGLDEMELGVRPVEALISVVQGNAARPLKVVLDKHVGIRPVHASLGDIWESAPISPKHNPET